MASAIETARKAIDDALEAGWVDSNSNAKTPISWPNDMLTPPDDGPFLAVDYLWGNAFMATKNGRNTVAGVLSIDIYVPAHDGTGTLYEYADVLRNIFSRADAGAVSFAVPSGPRIIPNDDSSHVRGNISTVFEVDETD